MLDINSCWCEQEGVRVLDINSCWGEQEGVRVLNIKQLLVRTRGSQGVRYQTVAGENKRESGC